MAFSLPLLRQGFREQGCVYRYPCHLLGCAWCAGALLGRMEAPGPGGPTFHCKLSQREVDGWSSVRSCHREIPHAYGVLCQGRAFWGWGGGCLVSFTLSSSAFPDLFNRGREVRWSRARITRAPNRMANGRQGLWRVMAPQAAVVRTPRAGLVQA